MGRRGQAPLLEARHGRAGWGNQDRRGLENGDHWSTIWATRVSMRLTRQADYGILLLAEIASGQEGAIHAAPELAAATGMPASMVAKTLKHLARQGLLDSTRGARGGYRLARPAKAISLADVVMAFEGP